VQEIPFFTSDQAYAGPRDHVWKMPRIPDELTYGISFTYRTRAEAEANARVGGTAFLIGKPMEGVVAPVVGGPSYLIYAVTNFHVAWGGSPVIRLHRKDGVLHVIELQKTDWVPHPDGDDLAVAFISDRLLLPGRPNDNILSQVKFVQTAKLITNEIIKTHNSGLGDEVFMIGRFLNHQGTKDRLAPAVRLGNISMMEHPIWNSFTNSDLSSFAVEMRSRTGFSGSPVAVYRERHNVFNSAHNVAEMWWWLLGVNWGYINEKDTGENTWLNGVVPAWKIIEVLESPALKDKHDQVTEFFKKRRDTATIAVASDEMSHSNDANPTHREDFNSLLGAAARKRESED
jgi:hypothetical protein